MGGVVVGVAVLTRDVAVVQNVVARPVEPGDDAHAGQALGEVAEDAGDPVAHTLIALVRRRSEPQRQPGEEGHDQQQRDERQLDVVEEEDDGDDDHGEPLQRELRQAVLQELLERLDVARHAGHDHARLLLGVVVEGEALQVRERAHPQLEHDARRHPSGGRHPQAARHRRDDDREDRERPDDGEHGPVVRGDAVVDADLAEERPGLDAQRLDQDEEEREREHPPVRPQHAPQADAGLRHPVGERLLRRLPTRVAGEVGLVGQELLDSLAHLPRDPRERQAVAGVAGRAADRPAHRRTAGDGATTPRHLIRSLSASRDTRLATVRSLASGSARSARLRRRLATHPVVPLRSHQSSSRISPTSASSTRERSTSASTAAATNAVPPSSSSSASASLWARISA